MDAPVAEPDWKHFLKVKSIDYKGWKNIFPALPREIGKVPLADVCTLGSKHYVVHFDQYLKAPNEWSVVRAPRVMVDDDPLG